MEPAFNQLDTFITANFWLIALIVASLSFKPFRLPGIILMYVLVINKGEIAWYVYAILGCASIFTSYMYPARWYSDKLEKETKKLEDAYMKAYNVPNPNKIRRNDPEDTKR